MMGACHALDRGSIPRQEEISFFNILFQNQTFFSFISIYFFSSFEVISNPKLRSRSKIGCFRFTAGLQDTRITLGRGSASQSSPGLDHPSASFLRRYKTLKKIKFHSQPVLFCTFSSSQLRAII
jgi:hypothetical protein